MKNAIWRRFWVHQVCSGSVVVTAYDFESGGPGSSPELGPIYYWASSTAQGLLESSLGTITAEHEGCVRPQFQWYRLAYATEIKSIQLHDFIVIASTWDRSVTLHYMKPTRIQWIYVYFFRHYEKHQIIMSWADERVEGLDDDNNNTVSV